VVISYHKHWLVIVTNLLADGLLKNLLCSKNSLTKLVDYQQPTCLCVKIAFAIGTISLSWELFSFMWGRHRHNCVLEMVFRFACVESECSAVEVAYLAQNIRHSSASVRMYLVVPRSLVNDNARSYWTILSPVVTGGFGGRSPPKQSPKTPRLKYETL